MIELKPCTFDDMIDGDADINIEYYQKSEVDAAIAELKQKLEDAQAGSTSSGRGRKRRITRRPTNERTESI